VKNMKSMNKKEGKKIGVMTAVILGFMVIAFMPAASATVTSFTVTPSTGIASAVDSYDIFVITDGVTSINITIPAGFIAVAPTIGGVQVAKVDFWNSSTKVYYGFATITANETDLTPTVDVFCKFGDDEITKTQDVDYTAGETTTIKSGFPSDNSSAIIQLPKADANGSINITINCTAFQLDVVAITIGEFVRNPLAVGDYVFYADGQPATVKIEEAVGYGGGIYQDGRWALRTENSPGAKEYRFWWGYAADKPVTGDWDGLGTDTIGLYRYGEWILSNTIENPSRDENVWWGYAADKPVTGDWDGLGTDTIGLYRDGEWILSNTIENPSRDENVWWGRATDIPVTGDWNGDGTDTIGLYRDGEWILSNTIENPSRDENVWWGLATDIPVTGDWNEDGKDTIGLYRDGEWILSDTIKNPSRNHDFWWGLAGCIPVTGAWI
jgi:hypothetical protein